ncbi:Metalloprotease MmpA [Brevundimonas sp. NIBR10]|uniref:M50 family metallopeptidase n=1 Tax=Brevundimonas sp. NIBR10 TaxID=3015997 RepID=UPI0022F1C3B6|nr:M50 family metallopeptidase [Brevundimonas sp. NIBR10]WGM48064.1 Metalloprotease MmpA [Brevundimonas sp. NIBR10]
MLNLLGQILIYIVPFLLVLTFIVTIHELGHYGVARLFKVKMDRFAIGFGRALFSRTDKRGVEWRIGWIPAGGYVKFSGDLDASSVPDAAGLAELRQRVIAEEGPAAVCDYFHFKPVWQRALITAGGPAANFILAIVIFTVLFATFGDQISPPRVVNVVPGSAAASAGFRPGDLILEANGDPVRRGEDVIRVVTLNSATPVRFVVERGGQRVPLIATPVRTLTEDAVAGQIKVGRIGLEMGYRRDEIRAIRYNPIEAVCAAVRQTGDVLGTTFTYIGRIFSGRESGDLLNGPLGIAKAAGGISQQATAGEAPAGLKAANLALTLIQFAAILSIGIGFINLMPIPVLDGGHLVFYAYEAVAKKPVAAKVQEAGYRVGLALLAGLMLFATWNDLQKLNLFKFLGGLVS